MQIKRKILLLIVCFVSGVLAVSGLYAIAIFKKNKSNSFIRQLPSHIIEGQNSVDLTDNRFYFIGPRDHQILFGRFDRYDQVLAVDEGLKSKLENIKSDRNFKINQGALFASDSANLYFADGISGIVRYGILTELLLNKKINSPYFSAYIPISNNSFILRCTTKERENVLVKSVIRPNTLSEHPELLQKQIDGLFCTDGALIKVPNSKWIFYIYYYRNQFICADTNLNLKYRGKTIDTNAHAKIKVSEIKSMKQIELSSPPEYVNLRATANRRYLFIQSALRADNELEQVHKYNAAIDVYAIKDGKYQFSFYLPNFLGQKLSDFKVYDNHLFALYGSYLYKYKLNFK